MHHDEGHVNRLMRGGRQAGWFLGCDGQTGMRREVGTDGWMDGWRKRGRKRGRMRVNEMTTEAGGSTRHFNERKRMPRDEIGATNLILPSLVGTNVVMGTERPTASQLTHRSTAAPFQRKHAQQSQDTQKTIRLARHCGRGEGRLDLTFTLRCSSQRCSPSPRKNLRPHLAQVSTITAQNPKTWVLHKKSQKSLRILINLPALPIML